MYSERIPGMTTSATPASHTRKPSSRSNPSPSRSSTVSLALCVRRRKHCNALRWMWHCFCNVCVCAWEDRSFPVLCASMTACRRETAFPISDPILRDASGCRPIEKTYCQGPRGTLPCLPGSHSFYYFCETFCTCSLQKQQSLLPFILTFADDLTADCSL